MVKLPLAAPQMSHQFRQNLTVKIPTRKQKFQTEILKGRHFWKAHCVLFCQTDFFKFYEERVIWENK
jgi:hypothetical protein